MDSTYQELKMRAAANGNLQLLKGVIVGSYPYEPGKCPWQKTAETPVIEIRGAGHHPKLNRKGEALWFLASIMVRLDWHQRTDRKPVRTPTAQKQKGWTSLTQTHTHTHTHAHIITLEMIRSQLQPRTFQAENSTSRPNWLNRVWVLGSFLNGGDAWV